MKYPRLSFLLRALFSIRKSTFFNCRNSNRDCSKYRMRAVNFSLAWCRLARRARCLIIAPDRVAKRWPLRRRCKGKGQIYLHDIRSFALQEARKRLKRAGIQNYQILEPDSSHLSKLKKKMDWVLVDAPCSGTGTLRRNPDMKWKFNEEMLTRLKGQQRMIFEKALSFLKGEGRIVYATCSLLREENQDQVDHFLSTYSLTIEGSPLQTFHRWGHGWIFWGCS